MIIVASPTISAGSSSSDGGFGGGGRGGTEAAGGPTFAKLSRRAFSLVISAANAVFIQAESLLVPKGGLSLEM